MTDFPELEAAKIVRLEAGDVVVLKVAKGVRMSSDMAATIKRLAAPAFPGHEIVVLQDIDVEVVRPEATTA